MDQIARADPEVASNIPVTWPYISRPDPVALIGSSYLDSPLNPLILYSPREDVHLETTSMLLPAQDLDSIQPKEDIQLLSSVLCPVDNDLGFNIVQEAPSNASTVLYQASGNASDEGSITSHALETSSVVSGYTQESFEAISCCKIRLMCSFGGKILPRPSDGKLRYVGGDTRIINVNRNIKYMDLRNKMLDLCEQPLIVKYQLPEEDLDSLVSVTTDEDVENMMEEYDRLEVSKDGSARLRIFLFFAAASEHEPKEFYDTLESSKHSEQQFVDAVNEIPDVVFTKHTRNATAELKVGLNVLPPSSLLSSGIMSQVSYPKYVFPEDWGRDLHNLKPVPYLLGPNTQDHIAADLLPWHDQSFSDESVYQKDDSLAHRALCCQYGCANSSFPGTNDPTTSEELFNMVPLQGQGRECGAIRARPVHGIGLGSSCLDVSCIEPQLHPSLAQSPPALSNRVLWAVEGQCQLSTYQGNHVGGFIQHQKVLSEVPSVSCDLHHAAIASHACQTGPSTTPYHVLSETSHHGACPVMQQQQVFATNPLMSARPRSEIHHGRAFHDCSHCMMPMQPTSSYFRTENALSRHRELPNACNVEVVQEMPISYKTVHGSGTKNLVSGGNDMIMEPTKEYNDCQSQMQALREATDRPISSPFEHAGCHNDSVCDISHGSCIYFSPRDQNTRMQQNEYLVGHPRGQTSVSPRASDGSYNHVVHTLPPLKQSLERSSEASVMPRPGVELNKGMIFGSSISHQETILPSEARVDKTAELEGCKIPKMEESASEVGDLAPCDLASGLIERDKGLVKEDTHSMISERTCDDSLVGKLCSNSMVTKDTSICIMQSAKSTNDLNYTTSTPVVEASGDVQLETEIGATDRKVETCDVHVTSSLNITPSSNGSLAPNMGKLSITNNASVAANSSLNGEPLGHMNTFAAETDDKDLQDNVISDFNVHSAIPSEGKHASVIVNSDEKGADQGKVVKTIEDNQTKGGGDAQVPTMASTIIENNLEIPSAVTEAEAIAHGFQIIKNADLEEIKALGSGTYGTVYYGKWRGSDVAIKRIKSSCFDGRPSERERLIADFWKEAYLLAQLHHPNVVAFYGVAPDGPGGTLATVTEYMVNGSLKQVLQRKDRTIDRRKRLLIAMDAAFGMEYLHGKNIVHFDLKCENLLVNMRDPQRPVCKVADLGLSKVKHKTMVSGGVRGTLPWMAPELLSPNSMVTEKVDVFSFGIMMWELLTGEEPYADMHQGAVIGGLVSGKLRPLVPAWCEPSWKSLMERCWSTDPKARPSFSEIASELRLMSASIQSRTQKANG